MADIPPLMEAMGQTCAPKPTLTEMMRAFLDFERDHDLLALEVKGHRFWAYVRYAVFYEIMERYLNFTPIRRTPRWRSVTHLVREGLVGLAQALRRRRTYDILLINYDRTNVIDGKPVNIHMYPISKQLTPRYQVLLVDFHNLDINAADYPCDVLTLRPLYLYARLRSWLITYSGRERRLFADLGHKLQKTFEVPVDLHDVARRTYSFQLVLHEQLLKVLRTHAPRLVAYCDTGNLWGVIEAAHRLSIPTVDFQHSHISHINPIYNYPRECAQHPPPTLSDYILSFGNYWKDAYHLPVTVLSAGFPYFDAASQKYLGREFPGREKNIIFIADEYSRATCAQVAVDLAALLPDYTIYYKLRSNQYADWRQRHLGRLGETKNIIVVDNDAVSLYEYFSRGTYQVGISSTAMFEGMSFGLIPFVLKTGLYEEMAPVYEGGYAFLVTSAEEIAELIRQGRAPNRSLTREQLFAPDSLRTIERLIGEVLEERRHISKLVQGGPGGD
jgi:hypothetical protein